MQLRRLALIALAFAPVNVASAQGIPYDECGTLVQGVTCPMIFADDMGRDWLLDDFGSFQLGDRVRVTGTADPACPNVCQQGNGCVFGNTIGPCDGTIGTQYCTAAVNSTGMPADLLAFGSTDATLADVTLRAGGIQPNTPGIFFFGPNQIQVPFGDGFRCVGGATTRIQPVAFTNAGGAAERALDFNAPYGAALMPGTTHNFQSWYRDPMAGMAGFNLTNGVEIAFLP